MTIRRATHQPVQTSGGPSAGPAVVTCRYCDMPIRFDPIPELWYVTTPGLGHDDYLCEANASHHRPHE